jgi:hypothetical protein
MENVMKEENNQKPMTRAELNRAKAFKNFMEKKAKESENQQPKPTPEQRKIALQKILIYLIEQEKANKNEQEYYNQKLNEYEQATTETLNEKPTAPAQGDERKGREKESPTSNEIKKNTTNNNIPKVKIQK